MQIKTERLTIRPFAAADIDGFMEYRNNEDWMRFQGFKGLKKEEYEARLLAEPQPEQGMQLAVADAGTNGLIGDIYLKKYGAAYWLGYTVHPKFAGQGYASEAARAVIQWAAKGGTEKILAGVLPENAASVKLLHKLGFQYIGEDDGEQVYCLEL